MKHYLGVDPGLKGGFGLINEDSRVVHTASMPTLHDGKRNAVDPVGVWKIYQHMNTLVYVGVSDLSDIRLHAILEKIVAFQMGRTSALNYGEGAGFLKMGLVAAGIRYELVPPQRWKKALAIPPKSPKEYSVTLANQMFGLELKKKDDGIADALLMAEYLRRIRND